MKVRLLASGAAAALLFAGAAQAAVVTYSTRAAFDAAAPGLVLEDFEEANLASGSAVIFNEPLFSATNNGVFATGDIVPGVDMTTTDGAGNPGSNQIFVGKDFGGVPGTTVSSNFYAENILLTFGPSITAFGIDLFGFQGIDGPWTLTLRSAGGDEGVYALAGGGFFGVTSTVGLTAVYLNKPDSGGSIDNLAFGAAAPEPQSWALMIMGFGLAGTAVRRRKRALAA